jgi:hypothetical protein
VPDVADGEHARDGGLQQERCPLQGPVLTGVGSGEDESPLVALDRFGEPAGERLRADQDEQAGGRQATTGAGRPYPLIFRPVLPAPLDDPGFPAARERFWTAALPASAIARTAWLSPSGTASWSGSPCQARPLDAAAAWARQLYVLDVHAADHGTGARPALLAAVVDPEEPVALWVADPNRG